MHMLGFSYRAVLGCLFPRWETTLTTEQSMLHLFWSLKIRLVVCKCSGYGIMFYVSPHNENTGKKFIKQIEYFVRLMCNLYFSLTFQSKIILQLLPEENMND